jgi:hypothetical protein
MGSWHSLPPIKAGHINETHNPRSGPKRDTAVPELRDSLEECLINRVDKPLRIAPRRLKIMGMCPRSRLYHTGNLYSFFPLGRYRGRCDHHWSAWRAEIPISMNATASCTVYMDNDLERGSDTNSYVALMIYDRSQSSLHNRSLSVIRDATFTVGHISTEAVFSSCQPELWQEPGSFRSVQRIAACPIISSHLCSIPLSPSWQTLYRLPFAIDIPQ